MIWNKFDEFILRHLSIIKYFWQLMLNPEVAFALLLKVQTTSNPLVNIHRKNPFHAIFTVFIYCLKYT